MRVRIPEHNQTISSDESDFLLKSLSDEALRRGGKDALPIGNYEEGSARYEEGKKFFLFSKKNYEERIIHVCFS